MCEKKCEIKSCLVVEWNPYLASKKKISKPHESSVSGLKKWPCRIICKPHFTRFKEIYYLNKTIK